MAGIILVPLALAIVVAAMLIRPFDKMPLAGPTRDPVATAMNPVVEPAAPGTLARQIAKLGKSFAGELGVAIVSIDDGWVAMFNGDKILPQQSVRKLWVAAATLDAIDRGKIALNDPVMLTRADLTLFHQPIRKRIDNAAYRSNVAELLVYSLTQSDNVANDVLYRRIGGEKGVADFLVRKGLRGISVGPEEKALQSEIAGLIWDDRFSYGRAFWQAREKVPSPLRARALSRYLAAPPDGATPEAIADALARLMQGEVLSSASTAYLIGLMAQSKTGPERLRGGLAEDDGWNLAHKTGTGQVMGDLATAYNDVGLLRSPGGRTYAVVVMIGSTRSPVKARQALMQAVTRAIVAYETGRNEN
ncbi:MAG: serine hydrolase [Sphingorhabdus sp.]